METTDEPTRPAQARANGADNLGDKFQDFRQRTEQYVREEPAKALGIAAGVGLFLTIFPVFRVVSAILRLFFTLLRPLLLCLGGIKLYEEFTKRYDK